MKKRWIMALALVLCLCLLTACKTSEPQKFQVMTQPGGTNAAAGSTGNTGSGNDVLVDGEYMDPLAEEDSYDDTAWLEELPTPVPPTSTPAPTVRGEYAGATPVPIDPIDKPTPTPVPPLTPFTFRGYDATKLGLSFEAPAGWKVNTDEPSNFVLTNPASRTTFQAELTLHSEKVSKAMSESDLTATVKSMLNAIGASDVVVSFSPTNTSGRTLLGANGVYADYTAVLSNGAKIRGRVHAVCVEKVLYTVHLAAPAEYWDLEGDVDYKDGVYDHLRKTMKITR